MYTLRKKKIATPSRIVASVSQTQHTNVQRVQTKKSQVCNKCGNLAIYLVPSLYIWDPRNIFGTQPTLEWHPQVRRSAMRPLDSLLELISQYC